MPASRGQLAPLPDDLPPAKRKFYVELRKLTRQANLSSRKLERVAYSPGPGKSDVSFTHATWDRWLKGKYYPPRQIIPPLVKRIAEEGCNADHLLELWDKAFGDSPDEEENDQPESEPETRHEQGPPESGQAEPVEENSVEASGVHRAGHEAKWTERALRHLARIAAEECHEGLRVQLHESWETLTVNWRVTGTDDDTGTDTDAEDGDLDLLTDRLRRGRRLDVLGAIGAGKSTLVLRLMARMLKTQRRPGDPVPVLFSASSYVRRDTVKGWILRDLTDRYPNLRNRKVYGPRVLDSLVSQNLVLPVIDGLDELDPGLRAALLTGAAKTFGPGRPVIVTSRPEEYHEAIAQVGRKPVATTVIELEPVAAPDAARFLERGVAGPEAPSWQVVAAEIRARPDGPLARAVSTPLMTTLARDAFAGHAADAVALIGCDDAREIEARILDRLPDTRFEQRADSELERPGRTISTDDGRRWLAYIARLLSDENSYDLAWARLRHSFPGFATPVRWAVFSGVLAWVLTGIVFGFSSALDAGTGIALRNGILGGG